jgi:SNF2 family DNA or RNA helicase
MTNTKRSLNLTTANRVFIIEPQWNPSVENQAVARAIRMNQTKSVLVTRYIIKATVEQVHYLASICVAISDRM